jgi:MFS transporter, DHA1 family, multidrug resistance protein
MRAARHPPTRHPYVFALIAAGTMLSIAGTDLVLPAIPGLPDALGGTAEGAQFVLAAFTAGIAAGLLLFGELGARFEQRSLLAVSLIVFGAVSALCALADSLEVLIALRFAQGAASAAAAVFAPGMLRALYDEEHAVVSAIGLLGSLEALAPALAPIAGAWLYGEFGWRASFTVIAVLCLALAMTTWLARRRLPAVIAGRGTGGYRGLLANWPFLRQALSYAFTLGGLLVFVFGAPAVFVLALDGTIGDFVVMQVCGISLFALAATLTGRLVARLGAETLILGGSLLSAAASLAMVGYAAAGGRAIPVVIGVFLLLNLGLGLRGPPGFHAAIVAAQGDDARGAALAILAMLVTVALGTAAVAPFIANGLLPIAIATAALSSAAVAPLLIRVP